MNGEEWRRKRSKKQTIGKKKKVRVGGGNLEKNRVFGESNMGF